MKAYNEQGVLNRELVGQAKRWHRRGLLTDEQLGTIRQQYPVKFRQTNGFLEIGLFLFTIVAVLACYLLLITTLDWQSDSHGVLSVAFGLGVGLVGQLLINRQLFYRNGIDNAVAVTVAGFLAYGLNQLLPENGLSVATRCLLTLPVLLAVLWYYGDTLVAALALATFYAFVFDGMLRFSWGKDALPFVLMGVSGVLYLIAKRVGESSTSVNRAQRLYYADPISLAQWTALSVLAASGNYFVVREVNGLLLRPSPPNAPEIALPTLFWTLTFLIPAAYLVFGFARRDRMLLILGGLGLTAAVMTVHEYAALVPLNVALALGGLVLVGIAVFGIRLLRRPRRGFSDAPDDDVPSEFFVNAKTLAAIQVVAGTQHGPRDDVRFGGGEFGGGGAGERY